ncbi:unnamed protein product [Amoebophrya sp. A120]|nr:unnamed protein product [Amoebophrya sp. A120]|eukprot:GSA120T00000144001.1
MRRWSEAHPPPGGRSSCATFCLYRLVFSQPIAFLLLQWNSFLLPTVSALSTSISSLVSLGENEETDAVNDKPFCVAANPVNGRDLYRFLLVSDYSGVSYFQVDPKQSEAITDGDNKHALIHGSPAVPGGYSSSIAVCCNQLYVAVVPPTPDDPTATASVLREKPKILQFSLVVQADEDSAAAGSPTAGQLGRLSVLDEEPRVVMEGKQILDMNCNPASGDLFIGVPENAAEGKILKYSGRDLSKLALKEFRSFEKLPVNEIPLPTHGLPNAVSADDLDVYVLNSHSAATGDVEKLLIADDGSTHGLLQTVTNSASSSAVVCNDAQQLLYLAQSCPVTATATAGNSAGGNGAAGAGQVSTLASTSRTGTASSCSDALFAIPKFPKPVPEAVASTHVTPAFLAARGGSTAEAAVGGTEASSLASPHVVLQGLRNGKSCATDGESTVFLLHQTGSGDYVLSQIVPGPIGEEESGPSDGATAATLQPFAETASGATVALLEEARDIAFLQAPAV